MSAADHLHSEQFEDLHPGSHCAGLVNLMRENHWSAQPHIAHERDLDSLIVRTAGDVKKLANYRPKS